MFLGHCDQQLMTSQETSQQPLCALGWQRGGNSNDFDCGNGTDRSEYSENVLICLIGLEKKNRKI